MSTDPARRAADLLGVKVVRQSAVQGGDLSAVTAILLDDGREAIVKTGPSPITEARMLKAIAAMGVAVPDVIACDPEILVLQRLPVNGAVEDAWKHLSEQLNLLHQGPELAGSAEGRFGWEEDHAFGPVRIENGWSDDWSAFWAEHRILNNSPHVPADLAHRLERLAARLPDRLPARPARSLLHGDLWGGNVLVHDGRVSGLIDPACYYGDREVDLAMLQVFNRPDDRFFAACEPLPSGRQDRLPVYQLWPALVHLRLFGPAYRPMVESLLAASGV